MLRKKHFALGAIAALILATGCPAPHEDACGPVRVKCVNSSGQPVNGILVKGAYLTAYEGGNYYTFQDSMSTGSGGRPSGCADVYACKGDAVSTKANSEYKSATGAVGNNLGETIVVTLASK